MKSLNGSDDTKVMDSFYYLKIAFNNANTIYTKLQTLKNSQYWNRIEKINGEIKGLETRYLQKKLVKDELRGGSMASDMPQYFRYKIEYTNY